MLALENKATLISGEHSPQVVVRAQPFGGAVRILNPDNLLAQVGNFNFDSEQSRSEQDFRIFVHPSSWQTVREYCLRNLGPEDESDLESDPSRELVEEFNDTLGINLKPAQYTIEPVRILVENESAPTENLRAYGNPTARIYRIYEVQIHDPSLWHIMLTNNEAYTSKVLRQMALDDAQKGGRGRANGMLVAPIEEIRAAYLSIPPEMRGARLSFKNTLLAGNVATVLDGIAIPKYQRAR